MTFKDEEEISVGTNFVDKHMVRNVSGIDMIVRPYAAFIFKDGRYYKAPYNQIAEDLCDAWNILYYSPDQVDKRDLVCIHCDIKRLNPLTGMRSGSISTAFVDIPKIWIPVRFIDVNKPKESGHSDITAYHEFSDDIFSNLHTTDKNDKGIPKKMHLFRYIPLYMIDGKTDGDIITIKMYNMINCNVKINQKEHAYGNFEDALKHTMHRMI